MTRSEIDAKFSALLERHEGRRRHPYVDSTGHITIGVGRNLTDRGLAEAEIALLLTRDIDLAHKIATGVFGSAFHTASAARQLALLSMAFNLGEPRLRRFVQMRAAIAAGRWDAAATAALDSVWARQVGARADEIAAMLRRG